MKFSECSKASETGGSGKDKDNRVKWSSGRTTTLSHTSLTEGIDSCPPNGSGYHDFYDFSGDFVNNFGPHYRGTFDTGWCQSPQGTYLPYGPFEI